VLRCVQPTLKRYQEQKLAFVRQQSLEKLEVDGGRVSEPELKRRRSQEVTPLEKPASGVSQLPELPADLKRKQVLYLCLICMAYRQFLLS